MRPALLVLFLLPLLALAQNESPSSTSRTTPSPSQTRPQTNSSSQTASGGGNSSNNNNDNNNNNNNDNASQPEVTTFITTFVSQSISIGSNSQEITFNRTIAETITQTLGGDDAAPTSSRTTSTPKNLPTAQVPENGGGGPNGAPVPGATGVNGVYGPDDDYIAAAASLRQNAFLATIAGVVVGTMMAV